MAHKDFFPQHPRTQPPHPLSPHKLARCSESGFSSAATEGTREYPILSRISAFDIGDARVVSLDLDEVAKSGGDSADRQTAVMYMLARYVLARHYYLTEENLGDIPDQYREYHRERVAEIREDHKRIVYDEFHRTSRSSAVRDQVVTDMREGRKWRVQIALLSQSIWALLRRDVFLHPCSRTVQSHESLKRDWPS